MNHKYFFPERSCIYRNSKGREITAIAVCPAAIRAGTILEKDPCRSRNFSPSEIHSHVIFQRYLKDQVSGISDRS